MKTIATIPALAILLLPALASPPQHAADAACAPRVEAGWIRLGPAAMPMLAGFGRIANPCAGAATVVSVSGPGFASVEVHESRIVEGVSRMREVPELRIGARGSALLAPGGLHLMLMQPRAPLAPGAHVELVFLLADGRSFTGSFEVRSPHAR